MPFPAKKTGFVRREKGSQAASDLILNGNHIPADIKMVAAKGGANVCEVTVKVTTKNGVLIPGVHRLKIWLTDSADVDGNGIVAVAPTGGIAMKAGSGTVQGSYTANKSIEVTTKADGTAILVITDAAKYTYNVCAQVGILPAKTLLLAAANFG